MSGLTTPEQLAEDFGIEDVAKLHRLRLRYNWPCVKLGREVRFTREHVEQIVAMQSVKRDAPTKAPAIDGQTDRSARRAS